MNRLDLSFDNIVYKIISALLALLGWLWVFLTPVIALFAALFFFVLLDFYLAYEVSRRNGDGFDLGKAWGVPSKLIVYALLLIAAHVFSTMIIPGFPMLQIAIAGLGFKEFESINRHGFKLTGIDLIHKAKIYLQNKIK